MSRGLFALGLSVTVATAALLCARPAGDQARSSIDVSSDSSTETLGKQGPTRREIQQQALLRAESALTWADNESTLRLDESLARIDHFFATAKSGTRSFAAAVLGWGSKWRYVSDRLPFTRGDRHEAFLREKFAQHVFREEDLARLIEHVAQSYVDAVAGLENQMLVKLREDLADLPTSAIPAFADQDRLSKAFDEAVKQTLASVGAEVRGDVATLVVSLVAQEVLTQVAVRMGVSAGVLSAGAASSWATFGIGLVVGLVVDQIISWVWNWWADPRGSLAEELNDKLDELRDAILEGDDAAPGLRGRLRILDSARGKIRRQALASLLTQDGESE